MMKTITTSAALAVCLALVLTVGANAQTIGGLYNWKVFTAGEAESGDAWRVFTALNTPAFPALNAFASVATRWDFRPTINGGIYYFDVDQAAIAPALPPNFVTPTRKIQVSVSVTGAPGTYTIVAGSELILAPAPSHNFYYKPRPCGKVCW